MSASDFDSLNRTHYAMISGLEESLHRARAEYTPFAEALAGKVNWGVLEFCRPAVRGLLKLFGFDALALANACVSMELQLARTRTQIEEMGMRPKRMKPDEFQVLAQRESEKRQKRMDDFDAASGELAEIERGLDVSFREVVHSKRI
ncbi:hypothetical protein [Rhizobium etli]|uniref:hypothetical protein n=1 Tax=Rhizobium etli TaxID=29449 RepID=UPI000383A01A|nr:hypothetical protein [Rhizobium etli]AGS25669.1 hypothetical protein REMIM1_PE00587 [Rhizobium etli bv. mimosae str. Mim1]